MSFISLSSDLYSVNIEISAEAYWALVKEAAEHKQHAEDYLENYVNTLWGEATPVKSEQL